MRQLTDALPKMRIWLNLFKRTSRLVSGAATTGVAVDSETVPVSARAVAGAASRIAAPARI